MGDAKVVVFDVETSGLDPEVHDVIQFAAVAVDEKWSPVGELELKIKFDLAKASPAALELNSYQAEAWASAISQAEAAARIGNFLKRHASWTKTSRAGKPYTVARLCAHNARFDCDFLGTMFKRAGGAFCPAALYEPLDTLALARWVTFCGPCSPPADHKLATICEHFGIAEEGGAHDALADVKRTAHLAAFLAGIVTNGAF
jgi:DNA polymerase-3 subunit epsilon